ncbi:MAG: serine--tRNA ligase [Nitrospirae bacterium]|nr:MAG: serine--tRNA ligase [Nitrospirota bacterium]
MLDLRILREEPERLARALELRGAAVDLERLRELERRRRELLAEVERKKAERNAASKRIGEIKRAGGDAAEQQAAVRALGETIAALDREVAATVAELEGLWLTVPNLPHPGCPEGEGEADNPELRRWGEPPSFPFAPRPHWELGEALGILDLERAAKLSGSRFAVLWGAGAQLERALIAFMLDLHTREHGYTEVAPPYLVTRATMTATGQLPKFEEDLFACRDDDLFLIPTAEVPVTNLHRDEILPEGSLPRRYCAYTACFRREAGSHGKDTRGLIRQHQFDKVELVRFEEPEASYEALEELTAHAEAVLQRLELPYRVVELCTGDLGFSAAKTYDLEVWLPGQGRYREISSCSNFEDFQARRGRIRYRVPGQKKPRLLHTLNGSGLAVGRTLVALLENHQEADGSVRIPEALRPYLGGRERLEPA